MPCLLKNTWLQLMCYMIPIPLYVTVEMIKLVRQQLSDAID